MVAEDCQGDHKIRYVDGGLTTQDNGQMMCGFHNRERERRRESPPGDPPSADDTG